MQFKEWCNKSGNMLLNEVKLSRVWNHLTNPETVVGIITAFRGEYPREENLKRNQELIQTLRSEGFGFFIVDGAWEENGNLVKEDSIFVTGTPKSEERLFELLKRLTNRYKQDGFSFKPSGDSTYQIIDKNGDIIMSFDNVSFNKISDIYTKLRGNKGSFVFEKAWTASGFIGNLLNKKG